jgi:hypothetical protein
MVPSLVYCLVNGLQPIFVLLKKTFATLYSLKL